GKHSHLAQDLKPVADSQHQAAPVGEALDRTHHGRKPGDSAGPQVVAVCETARQDQGIIVSHLRIAVPDEVDGLSNYLADYVVGIVITVGAGEDHHPKFHTLIVPFRRGPPKRWSRD